MNYCLESACVPVAVVIVAYNNDDEVQACLESLIHMTTHPVCIAIVDNSDTDNLLLKKLHMFCKKYSLHQPIEIEQGQSAPILYSRRNINDGFASANNFAMTILMHREDIEFFWFLNPDTIVTPNALQALVKIACQDVNIGVTGSTLVRMDGSSSLQAAAGARFNRLLGTTKSLLADVQLQSIHQHSPTCINERLDYITGASMLVRKTLFQVVGLMDERFFLYLEETEWCIRIRKYGYTLAWSPDSVVYHKDGGSSNPAYAEYLTLRNRLLVLRIHYPQYSAIAAMSYGIIILKRILRGQSRRIPLVCRALLDGLRGKKGRPDFIWLQRFA
jgi:GT2 family glycosyltransferase